MSDYQSNLDLPEAASLLRQAGARGPIITTTHAKPDGDAIGCVIALTAALKQLGMDARGLVMAPVPLNLGQLINGEAVETYAGNDGSPHDRWIADAALVVVVDTGAWQQLGPMQPLLERRVDDMLIIDHHLNGNVPAAHRVIDGTAAACAQIIARLLDHLAQRPGFDRQQADRRTGRVGTRAEDWKNPLFTPTVIRALFAGIASDTGWFRFSNTSPQTHELAARLIRLGVDHADLYARLEQTERPQKLALMIRALDSLKLLSGDKVALMCIRARDFAETGAWMEETERFVDIPQTVATVQVVALITEPPLNPTSGQGQEQDPANGAIRVSFRSKPGPNAVNVAELAQRFGGGGHARASGAKIHGPFEQVAEQIEAVLASL